VVKPADFRRSLSDGAPPAGLGAPLAGLWWAKKGNWEEAHRLVQDDVSADAAWVHAYLHRVESDPGNAGYWYRRARKPVATGDPDAEWGSIAASLLG
jgi:hypothetical protein